MKRLIEDYDHLIRCGGEMLSLPFSTWQSSEVNTEPLLQVTIEQIEPFVGKRATGARMIQRGYTPAKRFVLGFNDGSSLFAKIGTTAI
jgi:hypothetical protein